MLPRAPDWSYRRRRPGPCGSGPRDGPPRSRWPRWRCAAVPMALTRAAGLSGNQQQIADYLLEEVLERQPDHLKKFLLGTSILEHMTAPLCDAVLGTTDAAGSLEDLARSNAFIVSLDDQRECYRYHHLFGDLLRAELKRRHPELLPVYLGRAARWCEEHGSPGEAFAYAHEAGDLAHAGQHRARVPRRFCKPRADRKPVAVARPLHRHRHRVRRASVNRGRVGVRVSRRAGPRKAVPIRRRAGSTRLGIRRRGSFASLGTREPPKLHGSGRHPADAARC